MTLSANLFVERHALAQLLLWSAFYYLLPVAGGAIAAETGWPPSRIALAFTAAFLVWAALAPFVGRLVDAGRGERVMVAAGLGGAALLAAVSQAQTFAAFAAGMVLLGAAMAGSLYDPCFALVLRRFGRNAGPEVTKVTLVAGLATLLTFPLASALLAQLSWRGVFLAFAAGALVATLLLPRSAAGGASVREGPPAGPAATGGGTRTAIGMGFAAIMFSHTALLFALPVAFQDMRGLAVASVLPAMLGPCQIAGRLLWGALAGRMRLEWVTRCLFLVMLAPPLMLAAAKPSVGLILSVIAVQGAGYGVHTILRPMLAAKLLPGARLGSDLGRIAMIGLVMMAVAPAISGAVRAWAGFPALLMLLAAVNLSGLLLVWRLRPAPETVT